MYNIRSSLCWISSSLRRFIVFVQSCHCVKYRSCKHRESSAGWIVHHGCDTVSFEIWYEIFSSSIVSRFIGIGIPWASGILFFLPHLCVSFERLWLRFTNFINTAFVFFLGIISHFYVNEQNNELVATNVLCTYLWFLSIKGDNYLTWWRTSSSSDISVRRLSLKRIFIYYKWPRIQVQLCRYFARYRLFLINCKTYCEGKKIRYEWTKIW